MNDYKVQHLKMILSSYNLIQDNKSILHINFHMEILQKEQKFQVTRDCFEIICRYQVNIIPLINILYIIRT